MSTKFPCDRCERMIDGSNAGPDGKVECPYCGDMNRVERTVGESGASRTERDERAREAGLPAESEPEQRVMLVRPSIWRGSPWQSVGLLMAPLVVAGITAAMAGGSWFKYGSIAFGIGAALAWIPLFVWWLFSTMGVSLEITNKRTIERHGLLSRRSSEVMHDHVRNITIDQSFVDRVLRVGDIGISSAGQSGIEVHVRHLPDPKRIKGVIDLYRPL